MKPSMPSPMPALMNTRKAKPNSPETISQMVTGTSRMRARVMIFGRFIQREARWLFRLILQWLQHPCPARLNQAQTAARKGRLQVLDRIGEGQLDDGAVLGDGRYVDTKHAR